MGRKLFKEREKAYLRKQSFKCCKLLRQIVFFQCGTLFGFYNCKPFYNINYNKHLITNRTYPLFTFWTLPGKTQFLFISCLVVSIAATAQLIFLNSMPPK